MAEFSKLVITDTGQALLAKMIAGSSNIRFTKVSTSSATYDEMQLQGLDTLSDVKQTSVISGVSRTNETAIEVEAAFTNADLMEGYHMRALGLYAVDPDEGEILYAVAKELSGCCYMPAYNGVTLSGIILTLVTTVGNAESVSLEVTPAGIATYKDIQAVQTEIQSVRAQLGNHTVKSDVPAGAVFSDMVGATAETAGAAGDVPAPGAGKQTKYLRGDGTWQTPPNTTYADMTGATASAAGTHGLVPAPAKGAQGKYLRGDGTWQTPPNTTYADMTGATASAAGTHGLVPAPAKGTQGKYLRGDGTWQQAIDSLAAVRANTQQGYVAGALALKEAAGMIMTDTLAAGATTLTFTNSAITDDSLIDIYTDNAEITPSAIAQSGNTLTLTFDVQEETVNVKVRVS